MTLKTVQDALDSWYQEHRYELLRSQVELSSKFIRDELIITLATFPDPETGEKKSSERRLTLPELHRHDTVRKEGLGAFLHGLVDDMGHEINPESASSQGSPASAEDQDRMRVIRAWLDRAGVPASPLRPAEPKFPGSQAPPPGRAMTPATPSRAFTSAPGQRADTPIAEQEIKDDLPAGLEAIPEEEAEDVEMPPEEDLEAEVDERLVPPERREIEPDDLGEQVDQADKQATIPGKLERTGGPGVTAQPAG